MGYHADIIAEAKLLVLFSVYLFIFGIVVEYIVGEIDDNGFACLLFW